MVSFLIRSVFNWLHVSGCRRLAAERPVDECAAELLAFRLTFEVGQNNFEMFTTGPAGNTSEANVTGSAATQVQPFRYKITRVLYFCARTCTIWLGSQPVAASPVWVSFWWSEASDCMPNEVGMT